MNEGPTTVIRSPKTIYLERIKIFEKVTEKNDEDKVDEEERGSEGGVKGSVHRSRDTLPRVPIP